MHILGYYEIRNEKENKWSYFFKKNGESIKIWGDSIEDLKKKVKEKNLPWSDNKIPDENHDDLYPGDENQFHEKYVRTDWWSKSIYKQYNNHDYSDD